MITVHRLHLTDVTPAPTLPWARPAFPVFAHLVLHPGGPILIDTGVGIGNPMIDELYSPVHHDLDEALYRHGVVVEQVAIVITSHLHFDHCGQNERFAGARIVVQRAEMEAAEEPFYTVPEWAFPPAVGLTVVDGDEVVAPGVRVVSTPGHSPGHQSVVVEVGNGTQTVVCCQASWNRTSFEAATTGDDGWDQVAADASVRKLRALDPDRVLFSHAPGEWRRPRGNADVRPPPQG